MDDITKIAYNCRKATFLIEKQLISEITLREKMELKIHMAGCSVCRIFQKQSITINRMVHQLFHDPQPGKMLDEGFKKELQERIENELKK